jgi:SAM-dependent methyltransferase
MLYEYKGKKYPEYIRQGNAQQFVRRFAREYCKGIGLDVGGGKWPLPGAISVDLINGQDALGLPHCVYDYVFSSHCLEHLPNTVAAIEHWKSRIRPGGVLFLYLPHPDMEYWNPQNCRKHLQLLYPAHIEKLFVDLGFVDVFVTGRDLYWSFAAVGFVPDDHQAAHN